MRLIVRTFSELCISVGALIILFVVYVLFWTGVKAAGATEGQIDTLQNQWAQGAVSVPGPNAAGTPSPSTSQSSAPTPSPAPAAAYRDGKPFAMLYIPRFGKGWEWPVLENTEVRTLQEGLGHYRGTAPWAASAISRWPDTVAPTEIPSRTSRSCAGARRWC